MLTLCECACGRRWQIHENLAQFEGEIALACPSCGRGAVRLIQAIPQEETLPPTQNPSPETATLPPVLSDPGATTPGNYSIDDEMEPEEIYEDDSTLLARYELLSELGRGGMGVVYRAREKGLNRVVALKMILSGSHAGDDEIARFRIEAEAIAKLRHPNIIQVYEIGDQNGQAYFSLELCTGGSLANKLRGKPLQPKDAARILEPLARAMEAAHDARILHRDLKPANVLLAEDGTPRITDFGLAKRLDEGGQGKTRTGAVMGTPSYMAPEQAQAKKDIGPAADIYSLGAILYECLTGRPPFQAATSLDTILQVISEEPVPPRQLNSKVPRDLEVICLKCLQKMPRNRYLSAGALADDLKRYLEGEPIKARPPGLLRRTWRTMRKRPIYALLVVLLTASVLIGVYDYARTREIFKGIDTEEFYRILDYLWGTNEKKLRAK